MKSIEDLTSRFQLQTHDALSHKTQRTAMLQKQLNAQLLDINSELDELQEQREQVERALKAKQLPFGIMSKRLEIRKARPQRETVCDQVEEALHQEHQLLAEHIQSLRDKVQQLNQLQTQLRDEASKIESDLRDKTQSFNIDRRCQDLSQCQDSRQSTPSIPSNGSVLRAKEDVLRENRADLYRRGGARLVPKPPKGRTDTFGAPVPGNRA